MTVVEFVGVAGLVVGLLSFVLGAAFLGGRRWRSNYEAEHTRAERLQAINAELKDNNDGMSDRLARLDAVVQELGGQKVYEAMIEAQHRNLELFQGITTAIKDGDREITDAIRELTQTLHQAANGKD